MELNQATLRGILAAITSINEAFIVPKQGNWWNPQENGSERPDTWCAYRIKENRPRTAPFYWQQDTDANTVAVQKIATIELQFVGPQAEEIAANVATWPMRGDVRAAFQTVNGSIMYDDMTAVCTVFSQDGNNTVNAWNVNIKVLWYSVTATSQQQIKTINIGGQLNVR